MVEHDHPVLVTGGSGFLAGRVILRLLADGYRVRTTVRAPGRGTDVLGFVQRAGAATDHLEFVVADLTADDGWAAATAGCEYVLHVASPFPGRQPKDEDDVIRPAREGTVRVLRAAADANVGRVVMTSSFAAVGYSPKPSGAPFDETDWTDASAPLSPYVKSKTLAERDAWEFAAANQVELTVINPVGIFGPVLGRDLAASVHIVKGLLQGRPPVLPRASFAVVDVRDVADLHLRAMTDPRAAGQRFLAASGQPVSLPEIAAILRSGLGPAGRRVPKRELPDWAVRLAARRMPALRELAGLLGEPKRLSAAKAGELLGWQPRPVADTMVATAESLLEAPPD
ncbi:aldehyde reductase [Mycolicibacterium sp. P9-64]|uniref:SDR family oxidoreductase n=1 Tax=Mycolicibacterium sp. P9-64 TaxID=2024612 RepID=UPI0011EF4810|nr:aldehyde reductase [Mycolicibacterium sp. P9-64]KAA0084383.1 aldehyde reductase [Mycolicibacterium sp. P9-64]